MKTTDTIIIPNPSRELVAFIKEAQQEKKERMKKSATKQADPELMESIETYFSFDQ